MKPIKNNMKTKRIKVTAQFINQVKSLNGMGKGTTKIAETLKVSKSVVDKIKQSDYSFEKYKEMLKEIREKYKASPAYKEKFGGRTINSPRPAGRKVTQEVFDLVKVLSENKRVKVKEIAKIACISVSTVSSIRMSENLDGYETKIRENARKEIVPSTEQQESLVRNNPKVTEEVFSKAKVLVNVGMSFRETGRMLKISGDTVRRINSSKTLEEYRESLRQERAEREAKITVIPSFEQIKEEVSNSVLATNFDQYNSLITKLNAIEYVLTKVLARLDAQQVKKFKLF